jgi:hypothetical protein
MCKPTSNYSKLQANESESDTIPLELYPLKCVQQNATVTDLQ